MNVADHHQEVLIVAHARHASREAQESYRVHLPGDLVVEVGAHPEASRDLQENIDRGRHLLDNCLNLLRLVNTCEVGTMNVSMCNHFTLHTPDFLEQSNFLNCDITMAYVIFLYEHCC